MLKLASKFAMDILPSVIATVIGAYIVNHYINNRPPSGATAAAVSSVDAKKAVKGDSKPAEKSADLGNIHEPGVRAKGIPEKSIIDRAAIDKAVVEKPADKAEKPSETASIPPTGPAEPRGHRPSPRDKATAKTVPPSAAPATPVPAAEPIVAATAPPAEATPDANDLARAAIERLRGAESPRVQEIPRASEPPRVVAAPSAPSPAPAPIVIAPPVTAPAAAATTPQVQPLPPPILVSTPPADSKGAYPSARAEDPNRPTPPAEIPDPRPPLDLRADAASDNPPKRPSLGEDVLQAAKSMFHSVLPKRPDE